MPITADITKKRGRTFTFEGRDGKLKIRRQLVFQVWITSEDPQDASEPDVLTLSGLPRTNFSVYEHDGKVIPFLLCKRKAGTRSRKNARLWTVTCDYDSDFREATEDDSQPQTPPVDPTDITPRVEISSEQTEIVLYKDHAGNQILNPLGHFFSQPVIAPVPLTVLTITQYETGFSETTVESRHLSANEGTYRGKPEYSWMITSVDGTPTEVNSVSCHQVQYVVKYNPLPDGWKETRALIGSHYKDAEGKIKPFLDAFGQPITGFLKADGTKQALGDGVLFASFEQLKKTAFSFLPEPS